MPLLLLPNLLNNSLDHTLFLPKSVDDAVLSLHGLFSESDKGGRLFLSHFMPKEEAFKLPIALINENTPKSDFDFFLKPLRKQEIWGLISDAGLPCLADPGSAFVFRAKELNIPVKAFPGPSSIYLALMLSGLPSQHFAFHGYIPREREQVLKKWEKEQTTHIFIETPYRNDATLESCLNTLNATTYLSVSWNLTTPEEKTFTFPIEKWKKLSELPNLSKQPAIFIIKS